MKSDSPRYTTPLLFCLLAACVVRFWLFLLPESFWLDETVTAFVLRHGASHPSLAASPRLDQTVYYWLPRISQAVFGFSEFSLRLPSLLVTLVSLYLVARIAARLIHPRAAWFTVFLCFIPHEFTRQATDARPYGLGTCVAVAALWFLIRWLDEGGWRAAGLFALFAALLLRVHLIYWPFYAVFAGYALVRRVRLETRVSTRAILTVFAAVAASLVPLIPVTLGLFREAGEHIVTSPPTWSNVISGLQIPLVAVPGAAAWLLGRVFGWRRESRRLAVSTMVLLPAWWLWQPLCLLAATSITGNAVFLPRYFSVAIPGMMLASTLAAGYSLPERIWKPAALVLAAGILVAGFWREPFPPSRNSHWREAARTVNDTVGNSALPVICPSPFVEARPPAWSPGYRLPGFLYAHLDAYPVQGTTFLLPARSGEEGQRYAGKLIADRLVPFGRFLIYGGTFGVSLWTDWFAARPEFAHWHNFQVGKFGEVEIVEFVPNQ